MAAKRYAMPAAVLLIVASFNSAGAVEKWQQSSYTVPAGQKLRAYGKITLANKKFTSKTGKRAWDFSRKVFIPEKWHGKYRIHLYMNGKEYR